MDSEARARKALKTAIAAEKKSLQNYLEFGLKTDDASGKNMFLRLASDELEHMNILERQSHNLQECGDWLKIEIEPSDVEMIVPRLDEKDVKVRGTSGPGPDVGAAHRPGDGEDGRRVLPGSGESRG